MLPSYCIYSVIISYLDLMKGSPFSMYVYDATMVWMNATNQMVKSGVSPRNGTAFAQIAKQVTGIGITF